jgi:hypothetical protein
MLPNRYAPNRSSILDALAGPTKMVTSRDQKLWWEWMYLKLNQTEILYFPFLAGSFRECVELQTTCHVLSEILVTPTWNIQGCSVNTMTVAPKGYLVPGISDGVERVRSFKDFKSQARTFLDDSCKFRAKFFLEKMMSQTVAKVFPQGVCPVQDSAD